jgi:hypothetical protein
MENLSSTLILVPKTEHSIDLFVIKSLTFKMLIFSVLHLLTCVYIIWETSPTPYSSLTPLPHPPPSASGQNILCPLVKILTF